MKKILIFLTAIATAITINSCTKLDVPVESQYVKSNFPVTQQDYIALLGTMYSNLSSNYAVPYWRMQELSTDEAIIPARDGNFDDGGQYRQLHYHTWTIDHPNVTGIWRSHDWQNAECKYQHRYLSRLEHEPAPSYQVR